LILSVILFRQREKSKLENRKVKMARAVSIWLLADVMLSDAAGATEGYEAEDRHHQNVNDCETDQPEDGARLPLAPGCEGAEARENHEHRASELVEYLAGDAR
jgi:hypothetical protein